MNEQLNNTSNMSRSIGWNCIGHERENLSKLFMWFHDKNEKR